MYLYMNQHFASSGTLRMLIWHVVHIQDSSYCKFCCILQISKYIVISVQWFFVYICKLCNSWKCQRHYRFGHENFLLAEKYFSVAVTKHANKSHKTKPHVKQEDI